MCRTYWRIIYQGNVIGDRFRNLEAADEWHADWLEGRLVAAPFVETGIATNI